ncbi:MAG: hypothetical protein ACR2JX_01845 [Mycobacteriales bacterium]
MPVPRRLTPQRAGSSSLRTSRFACVLVDRDGTLIHDVPHNGDPEMALTDFRENW